jgi:hypothetical protein
MSASERREMETTITGKSLVGIDAGSDPPIHRIARMNMYLHGDGGSNIYFADALDKKVGLVGKSDVELEQEVSDLRNKLVTEATKFDVILSNPPFSLRYSRDNPEQEDVLNQYDLGGLARQSLSVLSSVLFFERYKELSTEDGRILAIVDDSILSGASDSSVQEILGDIVTSGTGMGRGRLRWEDLRDIEVPLRELSDKRIDDAVTAMETLWDAEVSLRDVTAKKFGELAKDLRLDGEDSRVRWLAYKPPE